MDKWPEVIASINRGVKGLAPDDLANIDNRMVLTEFQYQNFDKKIERSYRSIPDIEYFLPLIEKEAHLWTLTYKFLQRMEELEMLSNPVPIEFYALFLEAEAIRFRIPDTQFVSGKEYIQNLQSQNAKLHDSKGLKENPFQRVFTRQIFDKAIRMKASAGGFDEDFFWPWLKARRSIVTWMKAENHRLFKDDKPATRQGEKPEKRRKPLKPC